MNLFLAIHNASCFIFFCISCQMNCIIVAPGANLVAIAKLVDHFFVLVICDHLLCQFSIDFHKETYTICMYAQDGETFLFFAGSDVVVDLVVKE